MTPNERRDVPFIVMAGIIVCLIVILVVGYHTL
jgi:hypothetical protein